MVQFCAPNFAEFSAPCLKQNSRNNENKKFKLKIFLNIIITKMITKMWDRVDLKLLEEVVVWE